MHVISSPLLAHPTTAHVPLLGLPAEIRDLRDCSLHPLVAGEDDAEVVPGYKDGGHEEEADGERLDEHHRDGVLGRPGPARPQLVRHPDAVWWCKRVESVSNLMACSVDTVAGASTLWRR
ncbi:hypothetical protein GW17_00038624 [Ensete ventricosum]|nr:hypothetical protein GW17_00038624 [Ensete ventricosum]RZS09083.1 hypothetical protein BHM03_00040122 [Ensete ventricosum]